MVKPSEGHKMISPPLFKKSGLFGRMSPCKSKGQHNKKPNGNGWCLVGSSVAGASSTAQSGPRPLWSKIKRFSAADMWHFFWVAPQWPWRLPAATYQLLFKKTSCGSRPKEASTNFYLIDWDSIVTFVPLCYWDCDFWNKLPSSLMLFPPISFAS